MTTDNKIDGEEVQRIARAVARRFKRRCWWADVDDMESEACVAVLKAHKTFDPQVGVPFAGYAARAAALQITDWLWRQSSPLSGGLHDPEKNIAGVFRMTLDILASGHRGEDTTRRELTVDPDTGNELDVAAWRLAVREQLRLLAERTRNGDLAVEVLVRDRPSRDVMQQTGRGRDVYKATELVRRLARKDAALYELWQRAPGGS
jgi:DNA-directed RNA polymerase specialized sigma subunit